MAWGYKPYVPAAEKRKQAEKLASKQGASPVRIDGRTIASTFWGKAWCDNLERYSDYASRLPRGRTYVRNGSVVDLQIARGRIDARVLGSELYEIAIEVTPLAAKRWQAICADCTGAIDSLVELLQGTFSSAVMQRLCDAKTGMFPAPAEISLECSCPDWATMCKHVAAVLYGIGARLDDRPELLFTLRDVDSAALIATAGRDAPLTRKGPAASRVLASDAGGLAELFGLDLAPPIPPGGVKSSKAKTAQKREPARKPAAKRKR